MAESSGNRADRTIEIITDSHDVSESSERRSSERNASESSGAALPWVLRRVAFVSSLLLVGFIVFSGVEGLLQANSLDERIAETRADIVELRRDTEQLAAIVAWLDSDAYIERIAREDLGMVRPGEEAFAVHAPARSQLEIHRSPWWANLLPADKLGD